MYPSDYFCDSPTSSMSHLPRSSFSSSASSSSTSFSNLTSPIPPTLSSRPLANPAPPTISNPHLHSIRTPSETSLRFTHTTHYPSSCSSTLARLLLASVPLSPPPSLYLSCFPPAANVFHSLLALLAKHSVPHTLHNILTTVSVHPHNHHLPPLSPKDAVAVDFVRAVAEYPPRIPVELRTAFRNMYNTDRIQHIALLVSFAAYYSTIARLLGLTDSTADPSHSPYDDTDIIALTEPSEMSAPSSTTHSRTSSAKSSLPKRLSSAKNHLLGRVAHPLRLKLARHATHHLERSTWLADIPTTRRSQDDFIRAAMGFTPEYLSTLKNPTHRAAFIYLIDRILLRDSACGISTAVKNLCCYILARSAENSVLTAHSVFLANRFGADDRQLAVCTKLHILQAMQEAITNRDFPSTAASSSSFTSSDDENPVEPLRPLLVKRRRRADRFRYSEFAVGVVVDDSNPGSDGDDSDCEQELDDEFGDPIQSYHREQLDLVPNHSEELPPLRKRGSTGTDLKRPIGKRRNQSKEKHLQHDKDAEDCYNENELAKKEAEDVPLQPFYLLPDNPEVPEVDGLNSMSANDFALFRQDEATDDGLREASSARQFSRGLETLGEEEEEEEEIDLDMFTPREVSFLLLAHQVAEASRRNSRKCAKYVGAIPGPLIMPDLATTIHNQFDPESIMEMISVIGAFSFLLRWTVCYPYRPGALEAPVRRFVQTPIAHDLCVDTVGQRTNSKHGFNLRVQTGRSFRLPRHAVVPAYDAV